MENRLNKTWSKLFFIFLFLRNTQIAPTSPDQIYMLQNINLNSFLNNAIIRLITNNAREIILILKSSMQESIDSLQFFLK